MTRVSLTLTGLPVEILLLIAEFVSLSDLACLALSNRWLMSLFAPGESLKHRLPSAQPGDMVNERAIFLSRLSLDNPEYFFCAICSYLHPWKNFPLPPSWAFPKCFPTKYGDKRFEWSGKSMKYLVWPRLPHYEFYFTHLQLIMRRFYHGPKYGISTQSLFYIEVSMRPCEEDVYYAQRKRVWPSSLEETVRL